MILYFSVAICACVSQQHFGGLILKVVELDEIKDIKDAQYTILRKLANYLQYRVAELYIEYL